MSITPGWVALSLVEHLGAKKMRALLTHFDGDLNAILCADAAALKRVPGIGSKIAASILDVDVLRTADAMGAWERDGVRLIGWEDTAYPARLLTIADPPPTLFVRGEPPHPLKAVAIVGTRNPTPASVEAARDIAFTLASRGVLIVSGLALGVDANAHIGALAAPNGVTAAVLGGGVINIYPPAHGSLASAVERRGMLISEVQPYADPSPAALVARNRLISGLSDAVIVIETSIDGGAMYAARRALEQGRRVYVVENGSSGNRALLDEGAAVFGFSEEMF